MRFVRTITGILLLAVGLPILLAGGTLWFAGRHRDAGGAFGASLERVETSGYAIVVPDLDALLRAEAPFVRTGSARLRVTARLDGGPVVAATGPVAAVTGPVAAVTGPVTAATGPAAAGDGPAFLGVAPAADVAAYLAAVPHARVERVRVTRGALPVRTEPVAAVSPATVGVPRDQLFWTGHGIGVLDLATTDLRSQELSLVIMWPDARPGLAAGVRAEIRPAWFDLTAGAALAGGTLLILLAVVLVLWRSRPREVVFVVEPGQVSALAGRIGVTLPAEAATAAGGNRRRSAHLLRRGRRVGRPVGERPARDTSVRPFPPAGEGLGQPTRERLRPLSVPSRDAGEHGEHHEWDRRGDRAGSGEPREDDGYGAPGASPAERPRSAKVLVPTPAGDPGRSLPPWPELDAQARDRTARARPAGARPATLAEIPARPGVACPRDASASMSDSGDASGSVSDSGDASASTVGDDGTGVPLPPLAAETPVVGPPRIRPAVPVPFGDAD